MKPGLPKRPDDSFIQTNLEPGGLSPRKLTTLIALGLALAVVIVGTIVILPQLDHSTPAGVAVHLTPTATYLPTYTQAPAPPTPIGGYPTVDPGGIRGVTPTTLPYPLPGWQVAGPNFATTIGFAPSDPQVAYACGPVASTTTSSSTLVPIGIATKTAAGWGKPVTIANSAGCAPPSVNPQNPRDVIVLLNDCFTCAPTPAPHLYRSQDSGQTWKLQRAPADSTSPDGVEGFDRAAWAGGTLFAARDTSTAFFGVAHIIAASVNGQPLAWVDASLGLSSSKTAFIDLAVGTTCYISIDQFATPNTPPTTSTWLTSDNGKTWTPAANLQAGTVPLQLYGASPTGTSVIATQAQQPGAAESPYNDVFYRSVDGMKTWQQLQSLPAPYFISTLFPVDDGSAFAYGNGVASGNVLFKLLPGATQFTQLLTTTVPGNVALQAIQEDANGHAVAIWANSGIISNNGNLQPGLQTRTP